MLGAPGQCWSQMTIFQVQNIYPVPRSYSLLCTQTLFSPTIFLRRPPSDCQRQRQSGSWTKNKNIVTCNKNEVGTDSSDTSELAVLQTRVSRFSIDITQIISGGTETSDSILKLGSVGCWKTRISPWRSVNRLVVSVGHFNFSRCRCCSHHPPSFRPRASIHHPSEQESTFLHGSVSSKAPLVGR